MRCTDSKTTSRHRVLSHTASLETEATNGCIARTLLHESEGEKQKCSHLEPADERKACLSSVESHPKRK